MEKNKGSVDLDLLDGKNGKLVWRGVAVTDISDTGESPTQVKEALNDICKGFPARPKPVKVGHVPAALPSLYDLEPDPCYCTGVKS